jgi:uncharacterized protein YfdQ (DUF2303 family)
MDANHHTEAEAVAAVVADHVHPQLLTVRAREKAVEVLVLPKGLAAHSVKPFVDAYADAPERIEGVAEFNELDSFIAHVNRFKRLDSAVFAEAEPGNPALTCVYDYHAPDAPRFARHRATYEFPLSEEWKAWTGKHAKTFTQGEFAEWVEGRITEVLDPSAAGESTRAMVEAIGGSFASPSKLLELSRGLTVHVGAKVKSFVNPSTGETTMAFETEHADGHRGKLVIPTAFLIALPVFRGGALYQLAARLRYRVQGAAVSWWYELHRADRVFDHAFREACVRTREETELPVYIGTPEK